MKVRIFLLLLISISIWCNFNLAKNSQTIAYAAGERAAEIEYRNLQSMVKIHPRADVDLGNIVLLVNAIFTQILLLILVFRLLRKAPNKILNEVDGSTEPTIPTKIKALFVNHEC